MQTHYLPLEGMMLLSLVWEEETDGEGTLRRAPSPVALCRDYSRQIRAADMRGWRAVLLATPVAHTGL